MLVMHAGGVGNRLYRIASRVAIRRGYSFTNSCTLHLRRLTLRAENKFDFSVGGEADRLQEAEENIQRLVITMIEVHKQRLQAQKHGTYTIYRKSAMGRMGRRHRLDIDDLRQSLRRLCPIWPIC